MKTYGWEYRGARTRFSIFMLLAALAMASCARRAATGEDSALGLDRGIHTAIPRPTDRSGWFSAEGPDKFGDPYRGTLGSGFEGVQDAALYRDSIVVLDFSGRVIRIPSHTANPAMDATLYPGKDNQPANAIALGKNILYVADGDSVVRALKLGESNGESADRDGAKGDTSGTATGGIWESKPGFSSDYLLFSEPGYLVCFSSQGKIAVLSATDGSPLSYLDISAPLTGSPASAGAVLLVPTAEGVSAFELPDLGFAWKSEFPMTRGGTIWTINGILTFEDASGTFRVLNASDGLERYSISAGKGAQAASDGSGLYLAKPDGSLGAYQLLDGVPVWTTGGAAGSDSRKGASPSDFPRLAATADCVYIAGNGSLEAWNSKTGELMDRVPLNIRPDGLIVVPEGIFVLARGCAPYLYGSFTRLPEDLSSQSSVRPDSAVVERIVSTLGKYLDPKGEHPKISWRAYIPRAVLTSQTDVTLFRYDAEKPGNRSFRAVTEDEEGALIDVFDSNGEERHVNIGELGVDRTFEQWLDAGVWYVALGRLRGSQGKVPISLDIR